MEQPTRPGRELDAAVAVKVMGWTRYHDGAWVTGGLHEPSGWSPSTDIADAWQVVEHIKTTPKPERTFRGSYIRVSVTESADGSACAMEVWGLSYKAKAVSTPLAICLAALAAAHGRCAP